MAGTSRASSTVATKNLLDYVWMLITSPGGDEDGPKLICGALCVDPDGTLVTVTHGIIVRRRGFRQYPSVVGRTFHDHTFTKVVWIKNIEYESFGLSLLKVKKISQDQTFKFLPIPTEMSVENKTRIHGFLHHRLIPFSCANGRVTHHFDDNLTFPVDQSSPFYLTPKPHLNISTIGTVATEQAFGDKSGLEDVYSVSSVNSIVNMVKDGLLRALKLLNNSLPLVRVSGLGGVTLDGQCGCPVFTEKGNRLVGLVFLSTVEDDHFIIPVQIIGEFLKKNSDLISRQA